MRKLFPNLQAATRGSRCFCTMLGLGLLFALFPKEALADAGVPMLFVTMPAMLFGLIPIIGVEAFIINIHLNLTMKKSITVSAIANAISTLVGVPLTWIALVAIQMITGGGGAYGINTFIGKFLAVTWQAPWLIPYESELKWMVPIAMLVLLVPFFFVSWLVEYFFVKKMNKEIEVRAIKVTCLKANLISYGLLTLYPAGIYVLNH